MDASETQAKKISDTSFGFEAGGPIYPPLLILGQLSGTSPICVYQPIVHLALSGIKLHFSNSLCQWWFKYLSRWGSLRLQSRILGHGRISIFITFWMKFYKAGSW